MTPLWIIVGAAALLCFSGVPGCLGARRGMTGQYVATGLTLLGSLLGLAGTAWVLADAMTLALELPWGLPWGHFALALDPLGAMFLVPIFVVPALGAVYGLGYWKQSEHPANGRGLRLFFGLLAGAMALVVLAADAIVFLIAWEIMALAAFFLVTTESQEVEVRRAGWVYLVATHLGTLCLIAMFLVFQHATGSFLLRAPDAAALSPTLATAIFLLAVVGFGFKAGLMPLHLWLPGAHANAPSHVSAVLSGVMLKMGIYGLVRISGLLPEPAVWWGGLLLIGGAISGVLSIVFALSQRDIKRVLAYSSVENIGIICMGLGLALLGRALHRPDFIFLGLGGALFHVWNHSLFKPLLFFSAGAVLHATGTRDMEQLGGLGKRMPRTAALCLFGAVAICGLPPLNGFASEWLIYLGLFRSVTPTETGVAWPGAAVGVIALAMIGALALACFVKLSATVFLGSPRSQAGAAAHDPGLTQTGPMLLLAAGCLALGLLPQALLPCLDHAVAAWAGSSLPDGMTLLALAPYAQLSGVTVILAIVLAGIVLASLWLRRRRQADAVTTWGCGYAAATARMQYSGASFAELLTGLFAWVLWPQTQHPRTDGLFPGPTAFHRRVPDLILDRLTLPLFQFADRFLPRLRFMQQGYIQLYLLYILLILLVLFL